MNDCPPQPGLTLMQSSRSQSAAIASSAATGVPGLIATPALQPASWIAPTTRSRWAVASAWIVIESAPARANSLDLRLRPLDHQVAVDDRAGVMDLVGDRGDDQRADRDRRHEVAVHDVDVDDPSAGGEHLVDLLAEPGEVGGEDRGRDAAAVRQGRAVRHSEHPQHRRPALLAAEILIDAHPDDRLMGAAAGALRDQLVALQAVDAAEASRQLGRAQPRLPASRAGRPRGDRGAGFRR